MKKIFGLFGGSKKGPLTATIQPSGQTFEVPKNNNGTTILAQFDNGNMSVNAGLLKLVNIIRWKMA